MGRQKTDVNELAERIRIDSGDSERSPRKAASHRVPGPSGSVKSRAAVVAVAAGASFAAYNGANVGGASQSEADVLFLASAETRAGGTAEAEAAPVADEVQWDPAQDDSVITSLYEGQTKNVEREVLEELDRRPKIVAPAVGTFTSGYGQRWGEMHGGIDIANETNTPIVAATNGVVIDAGPAQGFGQWVRIMGDDGVMTVYGHLESIDTEKGQRVSAGDHIAGMGNRGFSTGTHLHFEVWENEGKQRVDPLPWLIQNGVDLGSVGSIGEAAENIALPGSTDPASIAASVAGSLVPDPANETGAPGLEESLRSTVVGDAGENTQELIALASGQTRASGRDATIGPVGVIAGKPRATAPKKGASATSTPSLSAIGSK